MGCLESEIDMFLHTQLLFRFILTMEGLCNRLAIIIIPTIDEICPKSLVLLGSSHVCYHLKIEISFETMFLYFNDIFSLQRARGKQHL